jgi:hypothetical protein
MDCCPSRSALEVPTPALPSRPRCMGRSGSSSHVMSCFPIRLKLVRTWPLLGSENETEHPALVQSRSRDS